MAEPAGRTALVTGGGSGIGAAVARALAAAGARVVVAARRADRIEAVASGIRDAGGEGLALTCDVTDPERVEGLAREIDARWGPVHVLVNNAGGASAAPLHRQTLEEWDRLLAVNATGPFLLTRALLPGMIAQRWGRVVNVASVVGLRGARYISAYAASKHALVGLTRAVAAEVAGSPVTVNAVCPGYVDTPMTDETVARIRERTGRSEEEARRAILERTPGGRLIEPEEVAFVVLSLCRHEGRSINGQAVVIDGGAR